MSYITDNDIMGFSMYVVRQNLGNIISKDTPVALCGRIKFTLESSSKVEYE